MLDATLPMRLAGRRRRRVKSVPTSWTVRVVQRAPLAATYWTQVRPPRALPATLLGAWPTLPVMWRPLWVTQLMKLLALWSGLPPGWKLRPVLLRVRRVAPLGMQSGRLKRRPAKLNVLLGTWRGR